MPPDASPRVRRIAERLQTTLEVRSAAQLAAVAQALELPALADALHAWDPTQPMTFSNLATAVSTTTPDGAPMMHRDARLLQALEHL